MSRADTQWNRIDPRSVAGVYAGVLSIIVAFAMSACSTGKMGEMSTLHAGQVVSVETRSDILGNKAMHGALIEAAVAESAIADGSVVLVRLMCCGGPSVSNVHGVYNPSPQTLPLRVGDIVELHLGGNSQVNTVTRVLQAAGQTGGPCWWDPKNDALWRRVMYCEWMSKEGWQKQEGIYTGWYKPAGSP
jgi:hypothetical protein